MATEGSGGIRYRWPLLPKFEGLNKLQTVCYLIFLKFFLKCFVVDLLFLFVCSLLLFGGVCCCCVCVRACVRACVVSCRVVSCRVVSCRVVSCRVVCVCVKLDHCRMGVIVMTDH